MPESISWGEGDVRDAMMDFDPSAEDWATGSDHIPQGIRGCRELGGWRIVIYAYWRARSGHTHRGVIYLHRNGKPEDVLEFDDCVDALHHALSLVRKILYGLNNDGTLHVLENSV